MMIFNLAISAVIVLFVVITAIASSEAWNDEIQKHYDEEKKNGRSK